MCATPGSMTFPLRFLFAILAVLLIAAVPAAAATASGTPSYTTTYIISAADDGSARWQIEYRTLLESDTDIAQFGEYTRNISSDYLPQVQDLMEQSALQASVSTGRPMKIGEVRGDAVIQESPTGKYGVVVYSFVWEGFARKDSALTLGDAFTGGMYLPRDSTLIIRWPADYHVVRADPPPDQQRDSLVWYGQRSFPPGEPRVILERESLFPLPVLAGFIVVIIAAIAGYLVLRSRKAGAGAPEPDEPADPLPPDEQQGAEERIVALLAQNGGEEYQSEIVRALGLPRSTVSAVLAGLHAKGVIVKVRKGRENLIRLATEKSS